MSQTITKYTISTWSRKVERIQIASESDKFVMLQNGRREAKMSDYQIYADTAEPAKLWMIDKRQREFDQIKRQLEYARSQLEEAKNLVLPA